MKCYSVSQVGCKESINIHIGLMNLDEMDLNLNNICAVVSHNMPPLERTLKAQDIESYGGKYFVLIPPQNSYCMPLYFYVMKKYLDEFYSYFDTKEYNDRKFQSVYYKSKDMIFRRDNPKMISFINRTEYYF